MFSVLVIRLRSLRLLRVSGIVMRLRMFLLLITFLKASRSEERFSRNAETDLVCRLLLEKKKKKIIGCYILTSSCLYSLLFHVFRIFYLFRYYFSFLFSSF